MPSPSLGEVLPFLTRAQLGGDWTASERARLEELAERLSSNDAKVSTVFGSSDAGDPWCVVTDDDGDVLVHVARINGRFVVHEAAPDAIQHGDSLWDALGRLLGAGLRAAGDDVVVSLRGREAQSLLALMAAAAFFFESQPAVGPDAPPAPAGPAPDDHGAAGDAGLVAMLPLEPVPRARAADADDLPRKPAAAILSALADSPPATAPGLDTDALGAGPAQSPAPAAAASEPSAPAAAETPAGAGTLQLAHGGPGADTLSGGPGADLLDGRGAPDGQFDLLNGGPGDDRLILRGNTIAVGGSGADAFVLATPAQATPQPDASPAPEAATAPPAPLGWVIDYKPGDGDRLEAALGSQVVVVSNTPVSDMAAPLAALSALSAGGPMAGARLGLDFNGDGSEDAYVMVGGGDALTIAVGQVLAQRAAAPAEPPDVLQDLPETIAPDSGSFLLG